MAADPALVAVRGGLTLAIILDTARGRYALAPAGPADAAGDALVITLTLERADGIERVALRCRVARALAGAADADEIVARLAPWLERDFESVRETALKTIRAERRMHEFVFDAAKRGPF